MRLLSGRCVRAAGQGLVFLGLAACGPDVEKKASDGWAKSVVSIDCCAVTSLASPDLSKTLIFTPDAAQETVAVRLSAGWLRQTSLRTVSSAHASWAPRSRGFFISDGEGSGQTSRFYLYRAPDNGAPSEVEGVHDRAVAAYRAEVGCVVGASDPEVWGLGWDGSGARVYVLVQSSVHAPCGQADQYRVMAIATGSGDIVRQYDAAEAARTFGALIPPNVLGQAASGQR